LAAVLRATNILAARVSGKTFTMRRWRGVPTPFHLVIDGSSGVPLPLSAMTPQARMRNRTRRRLGFVFMVLAVVFAALNLERTANLAMTGLP